MAHDCDLKPPTYDEAMAFARRCRTFRAVIDGEDGKPLYDITSDGHGAFVSSSLLVVVSRESIAEKLYKPS